MWPLHKLIHVGVTGLFAFSHIFIHLWRIVRFVAGPINLLNSALFSSITGLDVPCYPGHYSGFSLFSYLAPAPVLILSCTLSVCALENPEYMTVNILLRVRGSHLERSSSCRFIGFVLFCFRLYGSCYLFRLMLVWNPDRQILIGQPPFFPI